MVVGVPPQALLSIKDVSKAFPGVKALDRVSLEVSGGIVHGIVGENGAGKSTLMKILSGVYEKDSGEILFEGRVIDKITPLDSMRMGLAIIYQELNLVNTMTVGENVFLGRFSEFGQTGGRPYQGPCTPRQHRLQGQHPQAGVRAERLGQADGGDRQGAVLRLEAHHHGRAEQQPHGR